MVRPVHHILVYLDGSEESIIASQYAVVLARALDAQLHGIYVVNTRALQDLVKAHIFLDSEQDEYQRDLASDAGRYLSHLELIAQRKGVTVQSHTCSGTVHQEILNCIKEQHIDLLVLGELSRIRSRKDEFYNEPERAMRLAPCSVLIAKDEEYISELYDAL